MSNPNINTRMTRHRHRDRQRQKGAVLVVSLMILLVLTLIGVTAMTTSTLEERMAGNLKDVNLAFQAAESTLRDGERWLANLAIRPVPVAGCGSPPCAVWELNDPTVADKKSFSASWWQTNATGYSGLIGEVNTQPRYVIEYYDTIPDSIVKPSTGGGRYFYLITARGTGGTDNAQVLLQSVFNTRFNSLF